jgi:DNA polymerase
VQGAFLYAGASQTLRFSSKGLQMHNFKRDVWSPNQAEELKVKMQRQEPIENVMDTLGKLLRPAVIPEEGNMLVVGDWTGIEARALPWLAEAEDRLAMLRDPTIDLYQVTADTLGLGERQIGKVAELSLGYGGAAGAFGNMAANYGVHLTPQKVGAVVTGWRKNNQWAVNFWHALERAAFQAIRNPGEEFSEGKITYTFIPQLIGGTLICTLPSGDWIQYPRAAVDADGISAIKANWTPAAGEKDWPRVRLWHGLLAENVTQAICAALLRWAIDELIYNDVVPIGHVHDEIILDSAQPEQDAALLQDIMEGGPSWANGLPLAAKPDIMKRYGK